ncbi:MAG: exodeoxyribonuclease V subunit gamma [Hydrogenophilus sp.]|nr:exodeoxyribonuclease V subunit gamma [Hydrogenophilus sp.]
MLTTHHTPWIEHLVDQLAELLAAYHLSPLTRVPILTPSNGLERWLEEALAERAGGIFTQARFLFLTAFLDRLVAHLLPSTPPPLPPRALRWQIAQLLATLDPEDPIFLPLKPHLTSPRQRLALAEQIADLFERYALYRLDWLDAWANGQSLPCSDLLKPHEAWQRALWRRLQPLSHRGRSLALLTRHLALLSPSQAEEELSTALGAPLLVLFALSHLPPPFYELLRVIAQIIPVHLFILTPTLDFFGDLQQRQKPIATLSPLPHHPLLLAWGQHGRALENALLDLVDTPSIHIRPDPSPLPPSSPTPFAALLHDLIHNRSPFSTAESIPFAPFSAPSSSDAVSPSPLSFPTLELHRCHTLLRELEIARDRIHALLDADPTLTPDEIHILAPSIDPYRPFISALFSHLPHSIADRPRRDHQPPLATLIAWLQLLSDSELPLDQFLSFLGRPDVAQGLGLSLDQLEDLRTLLANHAHIRRHHRALWHRNDWHSGLARLLLGAIYDQPAHPWPPDSPHPIAPLTHLTPETLFLLRPLITLYHHLETQLEHDRKGPQPLSLWIDLLTQFAEDLYRHTPWQTAIWREAFQQLHLEMAFLPSPGALTLAELLHWAEHLGQERLHSQGFLTGGITFADLLPMRAIPARLIILLGMNDKSWPRPHYPPDFDLIAALPRDGDHHPPAEERYTFLELLLSVRGRLIILWQGLTPDTNQPLPPAPIVVELLETLQYAYGVDPTLLITDHPPLPLASSTPSPAPLVHSAAHPSSFPPFSLPDPLPLSELIQLLSNPLRWHLQSHHVALYPLSPPPSSVPLLVPEIPRIRQTLLQSPPISPTDAQRLYARLIAEGRWPLPPTPPHLLPAAAPDSAWSALLAEEQTFLDLTAQIRAQIGPPHNPPPIYSLTLPSRGSSITLTLTDDAAHQKGRLLPPRPLRPTVLLTFYLSHLLTNALVPQPTHLLLRTDPPRHLILPPISPSRARRQLTHWLSIALSLARSPLPYDLDWWPLSASYLHTSPTPHTLFSKIYATALRAFGYYPHWPDESRRDPYDPLLATLYLHLTPDELRTLLTPLHRRLLNHLRRLTRYLSLSGKTS